MSTKQKQRPASPFDGALIIDKPPGLTSHDVVSRLRRILRTKKIGHTGTLDPFATGVLVMLVGKATRLARFLDKDQKTYEAVVSFGFETETGDREGDRRQDTGVSTGEEDGNQETGVSTVGGSRGRSHPPAVAGGQGEESESNDLPSTEELTRRVSEVLAEFTGEIEQIPPMYSAKKIEGKKLYELARQGIEIEREPVKLTISELRVLDRITSNVHSDRTETESNQIVLKITCSAGTYIRTLAEDIGRRIGIGCHLAELRRTNAGRFSLAQALTLGELEKKTEAGEVSESVVAMPDIVGHLPTQTLDKIEVERISRGMKIATRIEADSVLDIRLIDAADELVAIGQTDREGGIQPKIVFKPRETESDK